jgi:hypothetical protein
MGKKINIETPYTVDDFGIAHKKAKDIRNSPKIKKQLKKIKKEYFMKKIIISLIVLSCLISCKQGEQDVVKYIEYFYPKAEIYVDGYNSDFFVINENGVIQFQNGLRGVIKVYPLKKIK